MKKSKILISVVLVLTLLGTMLVGCGNSSSDSSSASSAAPSTVAPVATESSAKSSEPVTLRFAWWGSDKRHEATLAAIKKYSELYPNVTIEGEYQGYDGYQQKLMTQIAGATEPDLLQLDYIWYPDLTAQGDTFVNLAAEKNIDLSTFSKSILDNYCSINGNVIALPMGTNGFGAMINKAFFDKHGLKTDTVWTWNSLIEAGKKIHDKNPNDYLFAIESGTSSGGVGPFVMSAYIYSKTGKYWSDGNTYKINASKQDFVDAFTMIKKLYDSGTAQPVGDASLFTGQMEQNPKWLNAEMGFTLDWSGTVGKYKAAVGEDKFAVGKPIFADDGANQNISIKPSMVLAVSKNSKNVDIATNFTNWFVNDPEAAKILGTQRSVPTSKAAFDTLNSANAIDKHVAEMVAFTNASPSEPVPTIQSNNEIADLVKGICESVIFNKMTPEAAADSMLKDVQAKLDSIKSTK